MKIAFITRKALSYDEAPPSRILNLKKYLEKYHTVYVFSKGAKIKEKNNISINIEKNNFFANQIFKLRVFQKAVQLLFREKVDFFIVREYYFVLLLWPFTKLAKSKIIYDMHSFRYKELKFENKTTKATLIAPAEKLAYALADKIIAVSPAIKEDLPKQLQQKTSLLPNGVNLAEFQKIKKDKSILTTYGIDPKKRIVGFIGNWMDWVDVSTIIKGAKYFDKNTQLIVIGRCYKDIEIEDLRKQYPNVIFTGRIPNDDVQNILPILDICILTYKKNAPVIKYLSVRKTMEYLACGKPIIMSDSDIGEKAFLTKNKNYVSFKPEDPKDFARVIEKTLKDERLLKTLAKNNKEYSKNLDWKKRFEDNKILPAVAILEERAKG